MMWKTKDDSSVNTWCIKGIDFESLDGLPVHIIFLLGAPERKREEFLHLIAKVGSILNRQDFFDKFIKADTQKKMIDLLVKNVE